MRAGLVSGEELFAAYQRAQEVGQAAKFLVALKERNGKAAELLLALLDGKRGNATAYIPKSV